MAVIVATPIPYYRQLLLWLGLLVSGCAAGDPQTALGELIAAAEAAAESRDTNHFRGLIAEGYVDASGNDRDRVIDLVRGYFLTHPSIDVFTRVETIELVGDDAAEVVVLAAVMGRRSGEGLLGELDGRLYRLDLELVETGGDWQLIGARWERALGALRGD